LEEIDSNIIRIYSKMEEIRFMIDEFKTMSKHMEMEEYVYKSKLLMDGCRDLHEIAREFDRSILDRIKKGSQRAGDHTGFLS
jgi:hypothetical protein